MPRSLLTLAMFALSCGAAVAQVDPPIANRPVDFSNIVGKYQMTVTAGPTEVGVEEPITLRVSIAGKGPKAYEPNRKFLKLFPEDFDRDFYIQEMRDEHRIDPKAGTWLFVYRLKPKHEKVSGIDGITLVIYDPDATGQNKFVTLFADAIPVKVTSKMDESKAIPLALDIPESMLSIAEAHEVLDRQTPASISAKHLAIGLALPPLLAFIGLLVWRRWGPDNGQDPQTRRRVARHLLHRFQGNTTPWILVHEYLKECLGFAALDATPTEVAAFLRQRGFAKPLCEQARAFFEGCDAGRFAPTKSNPQTSAEAARLIEDLEADPCARG